VLKLIDIYRPIQKNTMDILYSLLQERTPNQSISHKQMPTMDEHVNFILDKPYKAWYLIVYQDMIVGSAYLTKQNEIGIGIFKAFRRRGFGINAVKLLMEKHEGPFLANINPNNKGSRKMFKTLGGDLIQVTYKIG